VNTSPSGTSDVRTLDEIQSPTRICFGLEPSEEIVGRIETYTDRTGRPGDGNQNGVRRRLPRSYLFMFREAMERVTVEVDLLRVRNTYRFERRIENMRVQIRPKIRGNGTNYVTLILLQIVCFNQVPPQRSLTKGTEQMYAPLENTTGTENLHGQSFDDLQRGSSVMVMTHHKTGIHNWLIHTSAFCSFPSSAKTAATALPFASLTAPNRFPAYAPTMRPGRFAMMKPKPAPQTAPRYAHQ